jgi:hypothetical protein
MINVTPENTILGNLEVSDVYVEYDGPRVFICQSIDNIYLAEHAENLAYCDLWLYTVISHNQRQAIENNKLSIRDAFTLSESIVYLVTLYHDIMIPDSAVIVTKENIKEKWLPSPS